MKRVWHPYWLWEDWNAGMWRRLASSERPAMLQRAIEFTGNAELYGQWMMRVINEWPIACEHNLTDHSLNKLAWIGHAATCLSINSPEDITRAAWGTLSEDQQRLANKQAEKALAEWTANYERQDSQLCLALEA